MQQLTLQQLFGESASQNSQQLTINKADLPGLVASANNTAESLFVALLLLAYQSFTGKLVDETGTIITDELNHPIIYENFEDYEKLKISFWKRQYLNNFIVDTFVVYAFIKPPTTYGDKLIADHLSY